MKITRHPVDMARVTRAFQREREDLGPSLEAARRNPSNLHQFFLGAQKLYLAGSVIAPDTAEIANALRLAAQATTAIFVSQEAEGSPRPLPFGEGPPVTYTKPANKSLANILVWTDAFYLALITRQRLLSGELCRVPNDVFRQSGLVGVAWENYRFIDLLKAVWSKPRFTEDMAFMEWEEICRSRQSDHSSAGEFVRRVTAPLLQVLRYIKEQNEKQFAPALAKALEGHKEYWSSTEELRKQFNGLVSLPLTAAAALAHDRGLRFDVESDYLPLSWVRGDIFRDRP